MTALDEARRRATAFLAGTDYFAAFGIEMKLAADARTIARLALELADEIEAERSARAALQERCDRLQALIAKAAYDQTRCAA